MIQYMTAEDTNSLEVLQNTCLQMCLQADRYTSRKELYEESGICSLAQSCEDHTTKMVYLGLSNKSTTFVNQIFVKVFDVHDKVTRSSIQNEVFIPKT